MSYQDAGFCYHCGLPIADGLEIKLEHEGVVRHFCCTGCKTAFRLIQDAGLQEFYKRRDPQQSGGRPQERELSYLHAFDNVEYQKRYVHELEDGSQEIHLLLEGIHCAACVWLNEKVLSNLPGVIEARVNFSTHRALLRWRRDVLPLSEVIEAVRRIGYKAEPYDPESGESSHRKRDRDLLLRMTVAGFGAGNVMLIAVALYAGYFSGIEAQYKNFLHLISLLIATPVVFFAGWPFLRGAVNGLRAWRLTMDLPIALGAIITYSYSVYVTLRMEGEVYFDSVTMFLFILLTGRYLESVARRKAAGATERLISLEPRTAVVLRGGEEVTVALREVAIGEHVVVRPGMQIPLDGCIIDGVSAVDESMLTGESMPIPKKAGDRVPGGAINLDGGFTMRVTRVGQDSAIARIIRMVERAQASRPPIQTLADRVASWFVAVILLLASASFAFWMWFDPSQALENTVALLIITCPCALGLATPAAIVVATGVASRNGLLIKGGEVLERLAKVSQVVLDKTGTLTTGKPKVTALLPQPGVTAQQLLSCAASLERLSEHPLAAAIVAAAKAQELTILQEGVTLKNYPGLGVVGRWASTTAVIGRVGFVQEYAGIELPMEDAEQAVTRVAVVENGLFLGWIELADDLKSDAYHAVSRIHEMGMSTLLLSGDHAAVVKRVRQQVGAQGGIGGVLPGDKEQQIAALQADGSVVAMIGDGINDAPAMARADVAVAVANASDISMETADVVLLNPRLETAVDAMALSRATMRVIKQNLLFSLAYNGIVIPLAMAGLVLPIVAAVTMPVSSLIVVGNALRLNRMAKGLNAGKD
ncbi:heavy metal translocating P-type ATPase [Magnetococcus marinus MC-1]|uniref:Heavy metal translocating P-type ATPase n=1 Tax=Magnetococcus marinus (strain ATCC BAA-1437 / JCM 17883 / MC-1) TaxID=156889 RepID=A0LA67_MAGMM|nr:heavy metal translocating P-type ATPase [Magnetococcus marinus]ABK44860.1 heavy metal translocating P-type ATPase [Magnetococcus marinus MC-1]